MTSLVRKIVPRHSFLLLGILAGSSTFAAMAGADDVPPSGSTPGADRGRSAYETHCAACHGAVLEGGPGGPALIGASFAAKWKGHSADALLDHVRDTMPLGAPHSLDDGDYVAIAGLIRQRNGLGQASPKPEGSPRPAPQWNQDVIPATASPDSLVLAADARRQAMLTRLAAVSDDMLRRPSPADWLHWRRTYDAQGFSPLKQVNRRNVADLRTAWALQLGPGTNEITPMVHDGVMFISNAGRLQALDATTGEQLWQYSRPGSATIVRNLAFYGGLVYIAARTSVIAIDMRTGKVVWDRAVVPDDGAVFFRSGPIAAKGMVFQGVNGCGGKVPGGCSIVALNAATGKEVWRFNTIARPGTPGGDTWNGLPVDQRFGGSVWLPGSYDPELDLLYFGTGQTYQIGTLIRGKERADALYTSATVALRPETGELVWHYQHIPGDVWDLDWAYERVLATVNVDGRPRRTVTTGGKIGLFDTLDAETGKYLFSIDAGMQSLVTAIDPATGAKTIAPGAMPAPGVASPVCPAALGGRNWPATAYNPVTGIMFVPMNDTCMTITWTPTPEDGDANQRTLQPRNPGGDIGRVQAIDIPRRKTLWVRTERSSEMSAILATGGGLIFEGNHDRWFRASDDRTGRILWQVRLDASPSSFPVTYSVGGVQYVAVTTGGGNPLEARMGLLTPEVVTPSGAVTLWVFRLPQK